MAKEKAAAAEKPSNLFRVLSNVLVINSAEFAKAAASTQTKTIALANGKPIQFVDSFTMLSQKGRIRDALLAGKDVSLELEFNGIELTSEELVALAAVKPVLTKIMGIGPVYPWLAEEDFPSIECENGRVRRNGHTMPKTAVKRVWDKASAYWAGGKKPGAHDVQTNGSSYANRTVTYSSDRIDIGCQTIPRIEVEYIARRYGWEPCFPE